MGKNITFKGEIVLDLLATFPNHSTNGLARILLEKFPLYFKNFHSARTMVRTYRGEQNCNNIKSIDISTFERSEESKKQFMARKFDLPESDYNVIEPFIIPKLNNNILLLSDIHFPYQDNKALEVAINYGLDAKVNAVYLNGDTIDMYKASRFTKDPRMRNLSDELELTREFLKLLQSEFNCPIYYKMGNHEDRWENFLRLNAPELLGIPDFDLGTILRFREFGVTEVKSRQLAYAGKLAILHGHEFGHSVFSPVNPARGLYMRSKESSIIGHHHQTSEHSEKSLSGDVVTTWSVGALCGLSPEYMPFNKWNHGFAHIKSR